MKTISKPINVYLVDDDKVQLNFLEYHFKEKLHIRYKQMFDIYHSKLDLNFENEVVDKIINLDVGLDAFILIDSEDKKIATIALNSILDALI